MPQMSSPPLDILYTIMNTLADDRASLHACVLAGNRALAACAQTILYRDVSLSGVSHEVADLHLFSRTLSANPSLGALVKTLRISESLGIDSLPCLNDEEPLLTPALLPFSRLSELRILTLLNVRVLGVDGFLAVLVMLPKLERLVCDTLVDQIALNRGTIYDDAEDTRLYVPPPRDRFPELIELRVEYGFWCHATFANRLLSSYSTATANLQLEGLQ